MLFLHVKKYPSGRVNQALKTNVEIVEGFEKTDLDFIPEPIFHYILQTEGTIEHSPPPSGNSILSADGEWVVPALAVVQKQVLARIDAESDAVIAAAVGQRAGEYELAEREALAYRAAGYEGDVPASVATDAIMGRTAKQSADIIIGQATALRAVQTQLRGVRLLHKRLAQSAESQEGLAAVLSDWAAALGAIKSALGQA